MLLEIHASIAALVLNRASKILCPPARCPFTVFLAGRVPQIKIEKQKSGTLILTSLLEDHGLAEMVGVFTQRATNGRFGH